MPSTVSSAKQKEARIRGNPEPEGASRLRISWGGMHRKGRRRKRYDEAGLGVGSEVQLRDTGREAAEHPKVKKLQNLSNAGRATMEG